MITHAIRSWNLAIQDLRGGRNNDPRFFHRMRGNGRYAELLAQRYAVARRKAGYGNRSPHPPMNVTSFQPPVPTALPPSLRAVAARPAGRVRSNKPVNVRQGDLFA